MEAISAEVGRGAEVVAMAHQRFLEDEAAALAQLSRVAAALEVATRALIDGKPVPSLPIAPSPIEALAPIEAPVPIAAAPPVTVAPTIPTPPAPDPTPPRSLDRAGLLAHAGGRISAAFGPRYADLDGHRPRVRMPMPPLLLCDRVVTIEGERGQLGPARIVTEYDVPRGQAWTASGRPPPCVMVESGQADLLLVSYLGIDAELRGTRVYRLLDCDLTFHGPIPDPGETLRHDIRIDRFARLGATTLFYFHYDCVAVSDGRPVLSMRNGCAGFFTPAELATPRGVVAAIPELPTRTPIAPALGQAPSAWSSAQIAAIAAGRFSEGLGPAFAPADGSALTLPPDPRWRLVHRVTRVAVDGGPHGLGEVVFEQDLRDDDWFNPCHFVDDPCMPGTLMFDGCTQAVQVWLLAHGWSAAYPDGAFEPLPGATAKLRCRGQVVPGQSLLRYTARIKDAGLDPTPWAIADVILCVDGTDVVLAEDVGVRVRGERRAATAIDDARVMEYSVGSAERAFGPAYAGWDGPQKRCARMPGPPYLTMSRVVDVQGPPGEIVAGRSVVIDWEVAADAWFWRADPTAPMPFAVLLETALQPCGWLTAWQQMAIEGGRDLYFRNLGGEGEQLAEVWPDTGTLRTTATLTSTSASGGMRIVFFTSEVRAGDAVVYRCTTSFGYFTKAALAGQKGLQPPAEAEARIAALKDASALADPIPLAGDPTQPRDDWRMLHRVTHADPTGGRENLGFYVGAHDVDPDTWFFHAHFHLDPVMPGSLGLEALLQLARYAVGPQDGPGRWAACRTGKHTWLYRGQVLRHVRQMTVELEVLARAPDRVRCAGTVRADGLPIYRFDDFEVAWTADAAPPRPTQSPVRPPPAAALIDRFQVDGDTGTGVVRLDPALHPWLADHRPTVTAPAVPMAFAAEIAAEAAGFLRPGARVVAIPELTAERWIHCGDGPIDLLIAAVADGDLVAVTLAVHEENPRFPKLSGPKPHMRAVVRVGADWAPAEPAPEIAAPPSAIDIADYYGGGHTFHGPTLQAMTGLERLGPTGALATLRTRPDAELLGIDAAFALDPLLLDAATHPMWSAEPSRWVPSLPGGRLAYPVRAEGMRFFGPRPTGDVRCAVVPVECTERLLAFDVHLEGPEGPWCAYRWVEAVVDAGPWLGLSAADRRTFLWDRAPLAHATIGRDTASGWEVTAAELVEPLPGTLAALACAPIELRARRDAGDRTAWDVARLAAKEAVRAWLRDRLGRDVHPSALVLLAMRPDRFVVLDAPTLTAAEYVAHLGPTRFAIDVDARPDAAVARLRPIAR